MEGLGIQNTTIVAEVMDILLKRGYKPIAPSGSHFKYRLVLSTLIMTCTRRKRCNHILRIEENNVR